MGHSGSFLRGLMSGAASSALMLGIFSLLTVAFTGTWPIALGGAALMVGAIGIFNGVMGVFHAHREQSNARSIAQEILRDSEIRSASRGIAPQLAPQMDAAEVTAPIQEKTNWAERTGRNTSNLQAILDNGSLSAKDRAAAILAERDQAAATQAAR